MLTDSLPGIIDQGNIQYLSLPEFNVKNSLDYQLINYQEKITAFVAETRKVKVFASYFRRLPPWGKTNQPAFNFAIKDLAGVHIKFPIVTSGQRNAKVSQAKYDLEKSHLNKANVEQGLIMEFETAWSSYQTAFRQLHNQQGEHDSE